MSNPIDQQIILDKELRRDIDAIIQRLKNSTGDLNPLRHRSKRSEIPPMLLPVCPNCGSSERVQPTFELSETLQSEGDFFCACNQPGPRCFTPRASRERSVAITKLQEAVMWLGMDLKAINEENPGTVENPYPHSKDPSTPKIDPTADGLKL